MGWLGRLFHGSGGARRGPDLPVHDAVSDSELGTLGTWERSGMWGQDEPDPRPRRSFGGATAYLLVDQGPAGPGSMGVG